jgi:hypothetical protein
MIYFRKVIMSLLGKIIFRNFKNEIIKSSKRMLNVSMVKLSEKKKGNYETIDVFKSGFNPQESKLKVKLYPGFQQSSEEIYSKNSKEDEGTYGWN